jgi:hypothetical protein
MSSCNLVVYKVGNGTTSLSSSAFPVSIDEINTAGQNIQSISNLFSGTNLLSQSGSSSSSGFLNCYNEFLAVPGLNIAVGTSSAANINSKVTHIINATQSVNNRFVNTTSSPIPFNNSAYRCAVPISANTFYCSGDGSGTTTGGIWYYNGANYIQIYNGNKNIRNIEIFNDNLYFTTGATTNRGLYQLGTGLPVILHHIIFQLVLMDLQFT